MHEGLKNTGIDIVNQEPEDQMTNYSRVFATALRAKYGEEDTIARGVTVLPHERDRETLATMEHIEGDFKARFTQVSGIEIHEAANDEDLFEPVGDEYKNKLQELKKVA